MGQVPARETIAASERTLPGWDQAIITAAATTAPTPGGASSSGAVSAMRSAIPARLVARSVVSVLIRRARRTASARQVRRASLFVLIGSWPREHLPVPEPAIRLRARLKPRHNGEGLRLNQNVGGGDLPPTRHHGRIVRGPRAPGRLMTQVVGQARGVDDVGTAAKRLPEFAADLGDLEGMGDLVTDEVVATRAAHLGLGREPGQGW